MNLTVSPQVRAILLAVVLVAVALGLGLLAISHMRAGSHAAVKPIAPLHPVRRHTVPVTPVHAKVKHAVAPAHAKVKHGSPVHAKVKHAVPVHAKVKAVAPVVHAKVKHTAVTKPLVAPKPATPQPIATADGLPVALAAALRVHPVVVVALYQSDPSASRAQLRRAQLGTSAAAAIGIDQEAFAEAAAGAKKAHVGFLGIDVLSQRQASPLAAVVGVLPDPAVLVYARPDTVTLKIPGFADRDTVAQAAFNAKPTASR